MRSISLASLVVTLVLIAAALVYEQINSSVESVASAAAQESRTLSVLAGAGQDTADILAFFPQNITIRAGDTISWKQNSDSPHTVSFFGSFPGPGTDNRFAPPGTLIPNANLPVPDRPGVTRFNPVSAYPFPGPEANGSVYRPGDFVSSGRMTGVPPTPGLDEIKEISLSFDMPGP